LTPSSSTLLPNFKPPKTRLPREVTILLARKLVAAVWIDFGVVNSLFLCENLVTGRFPVHGCLLQLR
tara:strand:+ start:304 stop:504 length:201 start_codon:yes stop_codon:yes gene_type:complete